MISFFPDLNVWLALSVTGHRHSTEAWRWFDLLPVDATLVFSRFTNVGLLRLLTNEAAMRAQTLTLQEAWAVYDQWLDDPRIEFHLEPRGVDTAFRETTAPLAKHHASKLVGDCYLLALAKQGHATLVTFDTALHDMAHQQGHPAVIPG